MKIGVDINPTIEKVVGKGFFLKNLLETLSKIDYKNEYILYGYENPNFHLNSNFRFKRISGKPGLLWDIKCVLRSIFVERVNVFMSFKSFTSAILHPRSILSVHDLGPIKLPEAYPDQTNKKFKHILKMALKFSNIIITPSSTTKSYIVNEFNIPHKKIKKIYEAAPRWTKNRVKTQDFERVKKKYNLPDNYFLFVGTLEPRKNLSTLIDAFGDYKEKTESDYKLVIVGKKGFKFEELFKQAIDLGLAQEVIFTGHIPESDLKPIYVLAEAFVLPSKLEGFALSALEAMACEVPVLCSLKGAIKETVNKACLEIDPDKKETITKALITISKNSRIRNNLIKKGQERVKTFSWKKSAKKILKVFKSI